MHSTMKTRAVPHHLPLRFAHRPPRCLPTSAISPRRRKVRGVVLFVCPRKHARASSVFPLPSGLDDGAVREFQSSILRPPLTRPPTLLPKKDLISGSFNYDNKFSLDAKNAVPVDGLKLSCSATTKNGSTEPTGVVKSVFDVAKVRTFPTYKHVPPNGSVRLPARLFATAVTLTSYYWYLLLACCGKKTQHCVTLPEVTPRYPVRCLVPRSTHGLPFPIPDTRVTTSLTLSIFIAPGRFP